jgi:molybdate transport system substrate-binding protein
MARPIVRRATPLFLAGVLAICGCTSGPTSPASPAGRPATSSPGAAELTIYAAASLKAPLDAIQTAYEAAHPGTTLTIALDSSAALRTQIEQGAPADIFLSADTSNPKKLVDAGLANVSVVFAGNRLSIVVPATNPARLATPADLARAGVHIIAAGDEVPISVYAGQLIDRLAGLPDYPADFAASYAANTVSREDNVKAVIAKIELGEGDAGIVYATDAKASSQVTVVAIPADANVAASYAGLVLKSSSQAAAGMAFLDWLVGPGGQSILASFGFEPQR